MTDTTNFIYPKPVKPGAHIRVVSPSTSLTYVGGMEGTSECKAHPICRKSVTPFCLSKWPKVLTPLSLQEN